MVPVIDTLPGAALRREALDLQSSVAAGEFARDVRQIDALGVVAHAAVRQPDGAADLRCALRHRSPSCRWSARP